MWRSDKTKENDMWASRAGECGKMHIWEKLLKTRAIE